MFQDRSDAGRILARQLEAYRNNPNTIVLALPRGGVPVGYEVARELSVPLDVFLVRKLGVPGQEELAMGAIASGGIRILNEDIVVQLNISPHDVEAVARREQEELQRREQLYRGGRPSPNLSGSTVIVVDDGFATGASIRVAIEALRRQNPAKIIVAAPVAAAQTCVELRRLADEVVCPWTPQPFYSVGQGYARFEQTTDEEVRLLLGGITDAR
jgi:putative phosphoribosyl transferase